MIVFDLRCTRDHQFEGWFRSSDDFARQQGSGLLTCPLCDCTLISKAPMAPAVPMKLNRADVRAAGTDKPWVEASRNGESPAQLAPAELAATLTKLAAAQARLLSESRWVGDEFAERTRAIHYGEAEQEQIHGRSTVEEAAALMEEGIAIAPLPFPIVPAEEAN